ncbi:MAG: FAD-dependent oxidoreductase [Bacillota bacterium]
MFIYKAVVVGGGPGGYVAAIRAARSGARVALVEKEKVGGTCLNRGCIPTKIMAETASILHALKKAGDFGIAAGDVSFSLPGLMERKTRVVSRLVQGIEFLLKKNRVDYIRGKAKIAAPGTEMEYSTVPSCVYTHPEIGSVGMTEQEVMAKGLDFKTGKFPFMASGKAQAMGNTEGFVKIIAESGSGRILGVHILGPRATDLIAEAAVVFSLGATAHKLVDIIHAHPTLSEALVEAAEAVCGMSIHT